MNLTAFTALFLILLTALYAQNDPGINGSFPQGWYSETISRDGRNMSCRIYYPAFSDGENAPADTVSGPYPVVAFGHGFFMQSSYYISLYRRLASHGFIVIAPQFFDTQHGELGKDLIYCLNFVKSSSLSQGNRLYGIADSSKTGVSGHSMGGGASLLATTYDTTITIAAPFAAAETNPTIIGSIQNTRSYIYLISAQNDGITPPSSTQIPMYNNTPANKGLLTLKGGNHTRFMDTGIWDWTDPNGYLNRTNQIYLSQKYLTAAFKLFLYNDKSYWHYVFGDSAAADTAVILEKSMSALPLSKFRMITEGGTTSDSVISLSWERSSTLNPAEQISYRAELALDSLFASLFYVSPETSDSFIVTGPFLPGKYFCRITAQTPGGIIRNSENVIVIIITPSTGISDDLSSPHYFSISDAYPNPFNPSFRIMIKLPEAARITFSLTGINGEEVIKDTEFLNSGVHYKSFDMSEFPSGMYLLTAQTGLSRSVRKIILMK